MLTLVQVHARKLNQRQRLAGGALQVLWAIEPIQVLCDSLHIDSKLNDSLAAHMC